MPIPEGFTLATWFNQVSGDLSQVNQELSLFQKYWANFTSAQKTQIKNLVKARIDTAITTLGQIKTEIDTII